MRKFLLAAAIATCLALAAPAAATAAPAHVAPQGGGFTMIICFPVATNPPTWHCFVIQVPAQVAGVGPGDCPPCGEAVNLVYDPPDLKTEPTVVGDLGQGFVQLGQAAIASTPAEQAKLHTTAVNTFLTAARALGNSKVSEKQVGFVDPASGRFDPEPSPWRQQAGADVVGAVGQLQSYLAKQDPAVLAAATARLDDAYSVLAKNAATPAG
jgi:hypothetical protein